MPLLTLIRPPNVVPKWAYNSVICPPIGMAYIAGSVRESGCKVKCIDSTGEAISNVYEVYNKKNMVAWGLAPKDILDRIDSQTSILGFSCMFSCQWPSTYQLIKEVRQSFPGRPIIVGGEHVTSLPEFTLSNYPEVDICVLGEGEETILELIQKLSHGESLEAVAGIAYRNKNSVQRNPSRRRIRNIDGIHLPAWDLIPLHNYLNNELGYGVNRGRSMPMLATRGCPFECTFCSSPTMWTTKWLARNPKKLLEEIKLYVGKYRVANIDFYDLTTVIKKEWIIEFCQEIVKNNMNFTWQLPSGTRSEALDSEVTHWMYQTGCRNITYAPESGSPAVLRRIKKKVHLDKMKDSMRNAHKNGMKVKCNIIMGLPDENHFELWQTLKLMVELILLGVDDALPNAFVPYPGSELFSQLQKEGKIDKLDDEYFWKLSDQVSFLKTFSYSKYISSRALGLYIFLSLITFYSLSFLLHPHRFLKTFFVNPFYNIQETKFEHGYQGVIRRFFSLYHLSGIRKSRGAS